MIEEPSHRGFHENKWDASPVTEKLRPAATRRKRWRRSKDSEAVEKQRMTHILVERNRRKQMNVYLSQLRSFMPPSYAQRGDQASIVGGAINFIKEQEQLLQTMEAQKSSSNNVKNGRTTSASPSTRFLTFPNYPTQCKSWESSRGGDIEITVNVVERHVLLKILTKTRPRQLSKMVVSLESLGLTILHLNVTTTLDQMVLYSVSVKVEEGCRMNSVDEMEAAVNEMLLRIEEENMKLN